MNTIKKELTYAEILVLGEELAPILSKELDAILLFKLSMLSDEIKSAYEQANKLKNDLITKYGETDEKTGSIYISQDSDKYEDFMKDIKVLDEETKKIEFSQIKLSLLSGIKITSRLMFLLKDVIIDDIE